MTNWQKFKIISKDNVPTFNQINFKLNGLSPRVCDDGQIVYSSQVMCFNRCPFNTWQVGDYLEIDEDKAKTSYEFGSFIEDTSIVRKLGSSNEIVSRNNNNSLSISQSQSLGAIQMLNRAIDSDERNRYTASIEVDPRTGNAIYKLSGERK